MFCIKISNSDRFGMIRQIFIINKFQTPVLSRSFTNQELDLGLLSGFFSTLDAFAEQIQGGQMDSLTFKDFQFIFSIEKSTGLRFIISTDKGDSIPETKKRLELLKSEFLRIFANQLNEIQNQSFMLNEVNSRIFCEFLDDFHVIFQ